jgi:hypothetical protein
VHPPPAQAGFEGLAKDLPVPAGQRAVVRSNEGKIETHAKIGIFSGIVLGQDAASSFVRIAP